MDKQIWQKRGFALAARAGAAATWARSNGRLRVLARAGQQFALAFVLARGTLFGTYAPFGVAAVAAAATVTTGIAAAAGAIAGGLLLRGGLGGLTTGSAAILAVVCAHVFEDTLRDRPWFMPLCAAVSLGATSFVLPAVIDAHEVARLLCSCAVCALLTFCYATAIRPPTSRQAVGRPMGLLIVLSSVLAAFGDLTVAGTVAPARIPAMVLLLAVCYLTGSATGAAAGVAMGAAMDAAAGVTPYFACFYGLTCLIAGVFKGAGRVIFAAGALLAGLSAGLLGATRPVFLYSLYELLFAVLLFATVPEVLWQYARDTLAPARADGAETVRRVRRNAGRCAGEAAKAFYEMYLSMLSGAEAGSAASNGALKTVFVHAAEDVCKRCPTCTTCWQRKSVETMQAFSAATVPLIKKGRVEPHDFTAGFRARCTHLPELLHAMNSGLEALRAREEYERQCAENRSLLAQQYAGLTGMLGQVSDRMRESTTELPARARQVRRYAQAFGPVDRAAVYRDGKGRLRVELSGEASTAILQESRGFAAGLSALLGCGLTEPELLNDELGARIALREQAPFRAVVGVSQKQKDGERVSGDSGRSFVTEDGVACMMLADGMGTGEEAARDSRMILTLMERFLRAGVAPDDAVRTVAPAFRLKCDGMRGVTLDVLTLDLFTGEGACLKCGAAPGYLRTAAGVTVFSGGSLPIGLAEDSAADPGIPVKLGHGDLFVMLTDGVCDGSDDGWVRRLLEERTGESPKELALRLVQGAAARGAQDDLTALVVRVERRVRVE